MTSNTSSVVHATRHGSVLVVRISNPPVNALSAAVRNGLLEAVELAESDAAIQALVIAGDGKNFIAGADIREFGKPPAAPLLSDVCNRIEAASKLVVAALQGAVLGGGLEVALASHYRVAEASAQLGLPEVRLGLIPGAGGTQRAPRLMGVKAAAALMLGGDAMNVQEAQYSGLVDRIVVGPVIEAGIWFAEELLSKGAPVRRTRDVEVRNRPMALKELDELAHAVAQKNHDLIAPGKIVEAVRAAIELPFDEGLIRERSLFKECLQSPQREGLVHAFFAEREVVKIPEAKNAAGRELTRIAIIGGGMMGAGIAVSALDAGLNVVMIEQDPQAVARGQANVEKVYDGLIAKGRLTVKGKAACMARFAASASYEAASSVDMVIEAVYEDLDVKMSVFRKLDDICAPGTVLATNTSYLDPNLLALATRHPENVIGLHFFSPANVMRLLEVVVPKWVNPDVVATAFTFAKRLKKVAVRAGVCDGFIGNRMLAVYRTAADYMMEDGASPYEIDAAVRAFGFPMGPYQVSDLAGGEIGWATRKRRAATRDPNARYVAIADRICEQGWFGQKTQRGFYLYPNGARVGIHDPEVLEIVAAERANKHIVPRQFSADDIIRRYMAAMINEGAKVVEEGIALRPIDVDVTLLHGYGFPRFRGGPMKYADMTGLPKVLEDIQRFAEEDPLFWKPAQLLERLVREGSNFSSLNSLT